MRSNYKLIFFDFFNILRREVGIELDLKQYELLLKVLHKIDKDDWRNELLQVFKILWLTKVSYNDVFDKLYFSYIKKHFSKDVNLSDFDVELNSTWSTNNISELGEPLPLKDEKKYSPPSERSDAQKQENKKPESVPYSKWPEIDLRVKNAGQFTSPGLRDFNDGSKLSAFIFTDSKTLPFQTRPFQQSLKRIKAPYIRKQSTEIDVQDLIKQKVEHRFIYDIKYKCKDVRNLHIVWLSDHGGSMAPYAALEESLLHNLAASLEVSYLERYFFHDYLEANVNDITGLSPKDNESHVVYTNRAHTQARLLFEAAKKQRWSQSEIQDVFKKPKQLEDARKKSWDKNIVFFIFSDGGATRFNKNYDRVDKTISFINDLNKISRRILWVNPARNKSNTTAMYLEYFVKMIYPNTDELIRTVSTL